MGGVHIGAHHEHGQSASSSWVTLWRCLTAHALMQQCVAREA